MEDVDLFLSLAEIAGVFIGFGALIAARSGGATALDVVGVGMVVFVATIVAVMALAPVAISRFGITGHGLWVACSIGALLLWWLGDEVIVRTSRERQTYKATAPMRVRWRSELIGAAVWLPANVALALVLLGVLPDQERALYFAAATLFLLFDALLLLMLVFRVGFASIVDPASDTASDPEQPGDRPRARGRVPSGHRLVG